MRISDWSSDVCSSDLGGFDRPEAVEDRAHAHTAFRREQQSVEDAPARDIALENIHDQIDAVRRAVDEVEDAYQPVARSEEHTSELQSLMRISYAVFCLKKKTTKDQNNQNTPQIIAQHLTKHIN